MPEPVGDIRTIPKYWKWSFAFCLLVALPALIIFYLKVSEPAPAPLQPASLIILCLGDSITWGAGSPIDNPSYRSDLRADLAGRFDIAYAGQRCYGIGADGPNEGHNGWTTRQLLPVACHAAAMYRPDAVLLLIGVNNFAGKRRESLRQSLQEERRMIAGILERDGRATVYVGSPAAVLLKEKSYDHSGLAQFCASLPGLCNTLAGKRHRRRVVFVEIRHAGLVPTDYSADGVHPNPNGYAKIAKTWADALRSTPPSLIFASSELQTRP